MRACRIDGNHAEIRSALEKVQCCVMDLARLGEGKPDLLVARIQPGGFVQYWLIEAKVENGKLRPKQRTFAASWCDTVHVVRSADEAVALVLAGAVSRESS